MGNLNKIIFKLNNTILSALSEKSDIRKELIIENDKLSQFVGDDLMCAYKKVLNGYITEAPKKKEPQLSTAVIYIQGKKLPYAFCEFAELSKQNPNDVGLKISTARCLVHLKAYNTLLKHFIPFFTEHINEDSEFLHLTASTYFWLPEYYAKAIPLYEKLLKIQKKGKFDYNYRLAYLYERVYQDKKLDIQIKHAQKALESTDKTNIVNTFLAKLYYRAGRKDECEECFHKVLSNNPLPDEVVCYGRYLMKEGRIKEGFDKYRIRFETGRITYPQPLTPETRWDGIKDISNKTVIVHYEQGFGDSVMFSRYIPALSDIAGKVIFVVQKNLVPIFKSSGYEKYCTLLSHEADVNPEIELTSTNRSIMYSKGEGMGKIPHDYHIPLMDLPYLMNESPSRMKEAGGYLTADENKIKEFRKKYIKKNNKIKIGLAFHGTKQSIVTYRDISVKKFIPLLKMKGAEFYSFQADEYAKEMDELPKNIIIHDLGKEFRDFEDTACALNCMDLIISTDNVVMNLAGAMGVKTYGLFNIFPESRWYKTTGKDIGWYKSVRPFKVSTFNDWDNLILKVKKSMLEDFPVLKLYE